MTIPRIDFFRFDFNNGRGIRSNQIAGDISQILGDLPANRLGGDIPFARISGNVPTTRISGSLPFLQVSGNVPASRISGSLPFLQVSGDIPTNRLDGQISQSQLADDIGEQMYLATGTQYDGTNNLITSTTRGRSTAVEIGTVIYTVMATNVDRQLENLEISINGETLNLHTVDGNAVRARDLSPGRLYGMIKVVGAWRFLELLEPRVRDWTIYSFVSQTTTPTAAEIAAANSSTTNRISTLTYTGLVYVWFLVPVDTYDISDLLQGGVSQLSGYDPIASNITIGGIEYKGIVSDDTQNAFLAGIEFCVKQDP